MKLLIVDDEPIEREGMRRILSQAFPELHILDARNGLEAVEIAKVEHPQIVLMDIMMPGINGIEALKQILELDPTIRGVMVTAFDTFDYARQALRLGVKDYLLKPSKRAEIVSTVGTVIEQCKEDQHQNLLGERTLSLMETELVTQLLFHHVHDIQLHVLLETMGVPTNRSAYVVVVYVPEPSETIYSLIKEKVHDGGGGLVGALYGRQLPIVQFRDDSISFRAQAMPFAQSLIALLRDTQAIFVGVGQEVGTLEELTKSYQQAVIALASQHQSVRFRFYEESLNHAAPQEHETIRERESQFFDALNKGDWTKIEKLFAEFIDRQEQRNQPLIYSQQRLLELFWIIQRAIEDLGVVSLTTFLSFQSTSYRQLRAEVEGILTQAASQYVAYFSSSESNKVLLVKRHIEEHSHEQLSLERLAELVDLNPMYLSKLFKEKVGKNYIDYLTECRMHHAKQLLKDPEKSLKEIAYDIGYHEPNYFSKVFKKICGQTPSDYRKQVQFR